MFPLAAKLKAALQAFFGLPGDAPATVPTTSAPATVIGILKAIANLLFTLTQTGTKTLVGATSRVVSDTANINNVFAADFLLTSMVIREVTALDDDTAVSLGVSGDANRYFGSVVLTPADFSGGDTVRVINFGSGIPITAGSDFLVTSGGPATVGELEYTLVGVLV